MRKKANAYALVRAICQADDCQRVQTAYKLDFLRGKTPRCCVCGGGLLRLGGKVPIGSSGSMLDDIVYPPCESEFEIQSYIYSTLKTKGYDVRGELRTRLGVCRFDLVVFVDRKPVRIIEVKQSETAKRKGGFSSDRKKSSWSQLCRYRKYGIEVVAISGMSQAINHCKLMPDLTEE